MNRVEHSSEKKPSMQSFMDERHYRPLWSKRHWKSSTTSGWTRLKKSVHVVSPDTSGAIESVYRVLGLRVPLEGVPDSRQKCQVLSCDLLACRTMFFQHKTADFPLRLWLCEYHATPISAPKPVAVRALCPELHLESIPMAHRERMKDALTGEIQGYLLENMLRPQDEIAWTWQWVDFYDRPSHHRIWGTELIGQVAVERVEIDAA